MASALSALARVSGNLMRFLESEPDFFYIYSLSVFNLRL